MKSLEQCRAFFIARTIQRKAHYQKAFGNAQSNCYMEEATRADLVSATFAANRSLANTTLPTSNAFRKEAHNWFVAASEAHAIALKSCKN